MSKKFAILIFFTLNKVQREKTKGTNWFNLPATELTEEKKNDLMVLQMRRSLDPKRFYKASDLYGLPKYFEVKYKDFINHLIHFIWFI